MEIPRKRSHIKALKVETGGKCLPLKPVHAHKLSNSSTVKEIKYQYGRVWNSAFSNFSARESFIAVHFIFGANEVVLSQMLEHGSTSLPRLLFKSISPPLHFSPIFATNRKTKYIDQRVKQWANAGFLLMFSYPLKVDNLQSVVRICCQNSRRCNSISLFLH